MSRLPTPGSTSPGSMAGGHKRPISTRQGAFALIAQPRSLAIVALCLPFFILLWPPFYAVDQPELWGIPFFFWFQLACVPLCSLIILVLYWRRIDF
jgi:membrane protein implicated in regulation of membrane protease activity